MFPELPLPHSWADWDLGLLCRSIVLTQQHHRPGPSKPQLPPTAIVVLGPGDGYLCLISHPSLSFTLTHLVILTRICCLSPFASLLRPQSCTMPTNVSALQLEANFDGFFFCQDPLGNNMRGLSQVLCLLVYIIMIGKTSLCSNFVESLITQCSFICKTETAISYLCTLCF